MAVLGEISDIRQKYSCMGCPLKNGMAASGPSGGVSLMASPVVDAPESSIEVPVGLSNQLVLQLGATAARLEIVNTISEQKVDGRARRYEHRRPELLAAAVEYVLEHGVASLSLRPAASALGVSHATLLRHFQTKEALITEVIARIRLDLMESLERQIGDIAQAPTAEALRAVWRELSRPAQNRQFRLLFEIVTIHAREPERFGGLTQALIMDFIDPVEKNLRIHGHARAEARHLATAFLATVRGLQLDIAVAGDYARANGAMSRCIELMVRT